MKPFIFFKFEILHKYKAMNVIVFLFLKKLGAVFILHTFVLLTPKLKQVIYKLICSLILVMLLNMMEFLFAV